MTIHSVATLAAFDKRTAILDAATAVFAERGYRNTRLEHVGDLHQRDTAERCADREAGRRQ